MKTVRRIFTGGLTSEGFYSLHHNIIGPNRNMLYILKGMPGGGKSSMMKDIARRAYERGYTVEFHHCPSDPTSIDAIVIEELKVGLIDGTPPHPMDPTHPGITEKLINLTDFIDDKKIQLYRKDIIEAKANNKKAYRKAFNYFKAAKSIYREIEARNGDYVDFKGTNKLSKELIDQIFSKAPKEVERDFKVRSLFSSAYTPRGYYDNIKTILTHVNNRYYLKGEIGTGKTSFLKRIIELAKMNDYHIEIFHTPLFPEKIESVLIFELDTIISSNIKTTEFEHILIDFNQYFNRPKENPEGVDEDKRLLNELILGGVEGLKGARENHQILEESYKNAVNYKGIDEVREMIWREIEEYMKKA
ncbi:MAG: hypothetical protein GX185_05950 [Tissierellia bacterium]|nr:hypothetical protein [Tissierellia bacterium]